MLTQVNPCTKGSLPLFCTPAKRPCYPKPLLNKSKQISFPYSDVLRWDCAAKFPSDYRNPSTSHHSLSETRVPHYLCVNRWLMLRKIYVCGFYWRGFKGRRGVLLGDCSILKCFKVKHSRRWLRIPPLVKNNRNRGMRVPICRRNSFFSSINMSRNTAAHACSRLQFEMLYV